MRFYCCFFLIVACSNYCVGQSDTLYDAMQSIREFEEPVQLALIDELHDRHRMRIWTDASGKYQRHAKYESCKFKTVNGKVTDQIEAVTLYIASHSRSKTLPFEKLSSECQQRAKEILLFESLIKEQGAVNQIVKQMYKLEELQPDVSSRMHEVRQLRTQNIRVYLTGGSSKSGRLKSISSNALKFGGSSSGGFGLRFKGASNTVRFGSIDRIRHRPEDILYRHGQFLYASDVKKIEKYNQAVQSADQTINQAARVAEIWVKNSTNQKATFSVSMYDPPLKSPVNTNARWTFEPNSTARLVFKNGNTTTPLKTHVMEYSIKVGSKKQTWDWEFEPVHTRRSTVVEINDAKLLLLK